MRIFRGLFRRLSTTAKMSSQQKSNGVSSQVLTSSSSSDQYKSWTKEQLISKLQALESHNSESTTSTPTVAKGKKQNKQKKPFDFSRFSTRHIALRFSYLGWSYNGLAIQKEPTPLPTVEQVLIEALYKCRMIPSLNPGDFKFSRCGRTDKGVSAMNQVVSLLVRSNLTTEEQVDPQNDERELDYVNILNSVLPSDIKIHSFCLHLPEGFDARFSCTSRYYKYIFNKKGLDIAMMREAASYYLGENDFRNFCKLDGSKQVTNYQRTIYKAEISQLNEDMFCFELEGSAFLWHQVRNMIAVLFLVGQRLEAPEIVKELTDPEVYSTAPIFEMGNDKPLVLYDCKFDNDQLVWKKPVQNSKNEKSISSVYSNWLENSVKQQVSKFMFEFFQNEEYDQDITDRRVRVNLGDGRGRIINEYVPLSKRDRLEDFRIVNERWLKKKKAEK
ncbi:hypothetical protein WICPIJ_007680 [Wickerhamomyces pijperi]|uniref:Pseudouridine synthase I TruA alpha/beta domain-containing protein n=1 Tax=Wickerhamomyces pijperi TaxID=599730 RepID=A0A9P8Q178_WICPI|nr:hypothetical protein WICPIJ_007680 [Wickerhamomyces pijperi]